MDMNDGIDALLAQYKKDIEVDLALEISQYVHEHCKDVPHDIGLRIVDIVNKYRSKEKANGNDTHR